MAMTDEDLGAVRDEIGTAIPPTNGTLHASYDELGSWRLVALRILKRRRADLTGSEVASVTLPGIAAVSMRSSLAGLDRQIARLEQEYSAENLEDVPGARVARIHRRTARG